MHRRALPRLSSVSTAIRPAPRRYKSSNARPLATKSKGIGENAISETLRAVLSPEACELLRGGKKKKDKKLTIEPHIARTEAVESLEKRKFDALEDTSQEPIFLFDDTDGNIAPVRDRRFEAGTLVEIRRNGTRFMAVVLYTLLIDGTWLVHSLASEGVVWMHREQDVQFQLPEFVSKKLAEQCGIAEHTESEQELDARVQICRRLRSFEKRFEYDVNKVFEKARVIDFYDQVCLPDAWVDITVDEAAKKLLEGRPHITPTEKLAVQTYLLDCGPEFVVSNRRFLETQKIHVRPRCDIENIQAIRHMCITHHPVIDAFAEKARALILEYRRREVESWQETPSRHPLEGVEFTEVEKSILRFLVSSIPVTRAIQADFHLTPVAHILKKVGMYTADNYDDFMLRKLLVEMGVLAPWEEAITRDPTRLKRVEQDPLLVGPRAPTPLVPQVLGPDDLYPQDIVESLRHDFGNTPVYVVDDWNAEELDDGVSVERDALNPDYTWLHVHIADPTTLLPPTHRIAQKAFHMAETRYLIDRTEPMLPRDLFHQFSLGNTPGEPDRVLTFSAKVSPNGEIVDYKVRPAIVRNVRKVRYEEGDALLGTESPRAHYPFGQVPPPIPKPRDPSAFEPSVKEDFNLLHETSVRLRQARLLKGAVGIVSPTVEMTLSPRPFPEDLLGRSDYQPSVFRGFPDFVYGVNRFREVGARFIVAESMKLAGRVASCFLRDRNIPALRRSVGPLQSEFVGGVEEMLTERDEEGIVDYTRSLAFRVSAPSARYVTTPGMHSLLGISEGEGYVKVTSPLRRFGDTFAHWQIKHALLAEAGEKASPVLFPKTWVEELGIELELREADNKLVEKVQNQYWALLFLDRWMRDPAAAQRTHDPLQELSGWMAAQPSLNARTKEARSKVRVNQLGLMATLDELSDSDYLEVGTPLKLKVRQVKLGVRPELVMVPA
ncbi:RNB-domain-containing protein [Trametes coccinea BRFM310]|uniref:RNB-domain-containing protein n=1 Tax=Trametes coccinea (strain BRFM310) TaxID=1353009 RepID=A0A1Y2IZA0_TRAC3|nr:RNB-domain-containing protein [Trametes coccinea BRFM310]